MKEKSIEKVAVIPKFKQRKRVAAYVRVSVDKETCFTLLLLKQVTTKNLFQSTMTGS